MLCALTSLSMGVCILLKIIGAKLECRSLKPTKSEWKVGKLLQLYVIIIIIRAVILTLRIHCIQMFSGMGRRQHCF